MSATMSHHDLRFDHISREVSRLPRSACETIVLLGDAFIERNPVREIRGRTVINMGIDGDYLVADTHQERALLDRIRLLPLARPGDVVIAAGGEDIQDGAHPGEIIQRLEGLIDSVHAAIPSARIHLCSLPPMRDNYVRLMPMTAVFNTLMESLAEQRDLSFIDLFSGLEDEEANLAAQYSEDGLHLNETGYDVVNEALERTMKAC